MPFRTYAYRHSALVPLYSSSSPRLRGPNNLVAASGCSTNFVVNFFWFLFSLKLFYNLLV
jgi:hypothetical protein